jgi:tetratricopeptide (TPR) repeat protein
MSTYPGNPSLGDEVKQRILATYEQSVGLAESGRHQEAILGCDFVLELDPQFDPARTLKERLRAAPGDGGAPALGSLPDLPDLPAEGEGTADDLFDLTPPPAARPAAGLATGPALAPSLARALRERLAARDFQGVLERAAADRDAVAADPEAAQIATTAQSRLEAQPYVESFLREAGTALRAGDLDKAEAQLGKIASLDPGHPLYEDLQARVRTAREAPSAAVYPPAAEPAGPAEDAPFDLPSLDEDLELLDGFDVPDLSTPEEVPAWSPEASSAGGDDDLFSFDGLDPSDEPVLDPEPARSPAAEPAPAPRPSAPPAATPSAPTSSAASRAPRTEGDSRIAELLGEGDEAAAAGDYQGAIDAWSRIFLIDVDHEEAARRIEAARRKKAEREREVEEAFHEGLGALEAGDRDGAKARFERVLAMQPTHLAARDYLRQIESGEPISLSRGPSPDETIAMGGLGTFDLSDLSSRERAGGETALREEILVPPPPPGAAGGAAAEGKAGAMPSYGPAQTRSEPGRRTFFLVGGLVLVLVAAAGWWLFSNKDSVFPNSDAEEAAVQPEEVLGPIERATDLHEQGRTAMALGMLRRIRPDDPAYAEAQDLIARWEAPGRASTEELEQAALSPEALARRDRLVEGARSAYDQNEYLLARQLLDRADRVSPLDGEPSELREEADRALEPLSAEIALFEAGDYERLIPRLWRAYEEDPGNRDVRRMMVTSYYNRGVRELQRGDAAAAAEEFAQALEVAPDDEDLRRHHLFARTYQSRPKDLLYRIYVKYLPAR